MAQTITTNISSLSTVLNGGNVATIIVSSKELRKEAMELLSGMAKEAKAQEKPWKFISVAVNSNLTDEVKVILTAPVKVEVEPLTVEQQKKLWVMIQKIRQEGRNMLTIKPEMVPATKQQLSTWCKEATEKGKKWGFIKVVVKKPATTCEETAPIEVAEVTTPAPTEVLKKGEGTNGCDKYDEAYDKAFDASTQAGVCFMCGGTSLLDGSCQDCGATA